MQLEIKKEEAARDWKIWKEKETKIIELYSRKR
jgi:hypothetical protein